MKWRGSFEEQCLRAFLEGFWEGFARGIREDVATLVFVALALLGMVIILRFGR